MRTLFRRSTLGVASAALFGFSFGCTGTTNDPTVAGAEHARREGAQKYE